MTVPKLLIIKTMIYALGFALVVNIALSNLVPLGMKLTYTTLGDRGGISLYPDNRLSTVLIGSESYSSQTGDLIYFWTEFPFDFDRAKLTMTFKNEADYQPIYAGFRDGIDWHYDSKLIDAPLVNQLDYEKVEGEISLYQKQPKFKSVGEFMDNVPQNAKVGVFNLENVMLDKTGVKISGYEPKEGETVIDTPLRGKHLMYVYLENEPFRMSVEKQDLNLYEGEDRVNIHIYKEDDRVYTVSIDDDGIMDNSGRTEGSQKTEIANPGPELPESGVYKIVIDGGADTVIKSIRTNLHKIVFEGLVYPVENQVVYPGLEVTTKPTVIYSSSDTITAKTYHEAGLQTIEVEKTKPPMGTVSQEIELTATGEEFGNQEEGSGNGDDQLSRITIPKSNSVITARPGYFVFEPEQFFLPTPFKIIPIETKEDIKQADYILTDYRPPKTSGDWKVAEVEFDLEEAVTDGDRLNWMIRAPGVDEMGNEVVIKEVRVELIKDPIIKPAESQP